MTDVLACRACLSVDVKLHPIQECALDKALETVPHLHDYPNDTLPRYLCSFCRALSKRCVDFHIQCRSAHETLMEIVSQHGVLSKELLQLIDIKPAQRPHMKLMMSHVEVIEACDVEHYAVIKPEVESVYVDDPIQDNDPGDNNTDIDDDTEGYDVTVIEDVKKWDESDKEPNDVKKPQPSSTCDPPPRRRARRAGVKAGRSAATLREHQRRAALNEHVQTIELTHEEKLAAARARAGAAAYLAARYKCELCHEGFVQPAALRNHMTRHDPSAGEHVCPYCRRRYPSGARLRKHCALQHDRRYVCRRCGREDRTKKLAFTHQQWHEGVRHECDTCGATYKHKMNIQRHIARAHPAQIGSALPGERPVCRACRLTFFSAAAFAQHTATSSRHTGVGEDTFHCRECGASFPRRGALLAHARAAHPASGDVVECDECGKVCYVTEYPRHVRRAHPGALPFKYRRETASLVCICEVCGRKCGNKYVLRNHLMTHTGERPYQCRFCPKRKISKQLLKSHERCHTGERPYPCARCPKAFCDAPALKRHLLVHTGEKPYACSYCGKCFSQSNSMKLHVATVHHKLPAPYKRKPRTKKAVK